MIFNFDIKNNSFYQIIFYQTLEINNQNKYIFNFEILPSVLYTQYKYLYI